MDNVLQSPDSKVASLLLNYIFQHNIDLGDFWKDCTEDGIQGWLPMLKKYDTKATIDTSKEGVAILNFNYNGEIDAKDWKEILNGFAQSINYIIQNITKINRQMRDLGSDLRIMMYNKDDEKVCLRDTEFQMVRISVVTKPKIMY